MEKRDKKFFGLPISDLSWFEIQFLVGIAVGIAANTLFTVFVLPRLQQQPV